MHRYITKETQGPSGDQNLDENVSEPKILHRASNFDGTALQLANVDAC